MLKKLVTRKYGELQLVFGCIVTLILLMLIWNVIQFKNPFMIKNKYIINNKLDDIVIKLIIFDFDKTITSLPLYGILKNNYSLNTEIKQLNKLNDIDMIDIFGGINRINRLNKHLLIIMMI